RRTLSTAVVGPLKHRRGGDKRAPFPLHPPSHRTVLTGKRPASACASPARLAPAYRTRWPTRPAVTEPPGAERLACPSGRDKTKRGKGARSHRRATRR